MVVCLERRWLSLVAKGEACPSTSPTCASLANEKVGQWNKAKRRQPKTHTHTTRERPKKKSRQRRDSNSRVQRTLRFKSNAITTRPRRLWVTWAAVWHLKDNGLPASTPSTSPALAGLGRRQRRNKNNEPECRRVPCCVSLLQTGNSGRLKREQYEHNASAK